MWNSTGVVGYIAVLMIVGASLVSGGETGAYARTRADAFSAVAQFEDAPVLDTDHSTDRHLRVYLDGVAYE